MASLKIFLFGPPRVEMDGTTVELTRRKALALLIYLAVNAQPYSRDALATLFYSDHSQSKARAYLRRDLAVLKATPLKPWLDTEQDIVALTPGADLWLDVAHFRQRLMAVQNHDHPLDDSCAGCLASLSETVDLYTDDFLAGFTLRDCPDFDEWQFFQTESLRQELATALERLVQGYCRQGDPDAAIFHARRWVALDPLHEPAQQVLMQVYHQAGQQAAALRQYEGFAELALLLGHYEQAATMGQQALDLARQTEDKQTIAWAQHLRSRAQLRPDLPQAEVEKIAGRLQEAVNLYEQLGNPFGAAKVRLTQCGLVYLRGLLDQAVALCERSLADFQTFDFQLGVVAALRHRAWLAYDQGDPAQAETWFRESLEQAHALQYTHATTLALIGLARLHVEAGQASLAAQLVGAVEAIQHNIGSMLTPMQRPRYEQTITAIRNALDEADYQAARREGQQLSLAEAVRLTSAPSTQPIIDVDHD